MEKTATMNLSVSPSVMHGAEEVLKDLGISMATAIDLYLRQIALNKSIPFPITLNQAPLSINADNMSAEELHEALMVGYGQMENGQMQDAATAFAKFREEHR